MIGNIIRLLHTDEFLGVSNNVEIAKGKHEIVRTMAIGKRKIRRKWHEKRK